jgi:hypothetical protein
VCCLLHLHSDAPSLSCSQRSIDQLQLSTSTHYSESNMARHTLTTTGNVSFECSSKLNDSALGRFWNSIRSSGEIFDYDQLSHAQTTSPSSSSKNSPGELLLDLEYDDDGETIDLSPKASQMGSARAPPKNSSEESTSPLANSAVDVAEEELLLDIEYNDDGETIGLSPTASETGSACASPDFNDIDTSDTSPNASMTNVSIAFTNPSNASYRLIRPSPTMGPAPFTRLHFISFSPLPPFSGPHTALSIPFGPDLGSSYLHLPLNLRAAHINFADLAISYLWSGHRRDDTFSPMLPKRRKITGPPQAPSPMTQTTFAPYLGPRTCVVNYGKKANGWILHVPRYLTPKEIAVATKNLEDIAGRDEWNVYVGGVKSEGKELEMLKEKLEEQEWEMKFLEEVMGLDFGALDEEDAVFVPIWVEKDDVQRDGKHGSDEVDAAFTKATQLHGLDLSVDLPRITLDSSVK